MKFIQLLVSMGCMLQLLACGSLMRGFSGETLISDAQPALSVSVEMPLLTLGQTTPYLYTMYGYQFPMTYVAVYGTDSQSPMAISILSIAPNNWEWDPLSFSMPDSPVTSYVAFGGESFDGSIHIINGEKDPFTILVMSREKVSSMYWMAQRYAYRAFFNQVKIIFEYREPLPSQFLGNTKIPMESREIYEFQQRAAATFHVDFSYSGSSKPEAPYLKGINTKVLGNYLGSMSVVEPIFLDR